MQPDRDKMDSFDKPIREFLSYAKIEAGLAANTLEAYARDLRDLVSDLREHDFPGHPADLKPEDLANHLRRLRSERKMATSSIVRHLATFRIFFRFLSSGGHIDEDPTNLLDRPTAWQRIPGFLSTKRVEQLLQAPHPDQGDLWLRDRALLHFMYASGLRASEVGILELRDYNSTLGLVNVLGKGNKQRLVPMYQQACAAVDRYLSELRPRLVRPDGRDKSRILLSRTGRPLERVAVWQIVKRQAQHAGLKDVHPHTIRHSFATHLVSGGADLRVVQELLGHSNIRTTQVYTHVDTKRLQDIHAKYHPRG